MSAAAHPRSAGGSDGLKQPILPRSMVPLSFREIPPLSRIRVRMAARRPQRGRRIRRRRLDGRWSPSRFRGESTNRKPSVLTIRLSADNRMPTWQHSVVGAWTGFRSNWFAGSWPSHERLRLTSSKVALHRTPSRRRVSGSKSNDWCSVPKAARRLRRSGVPNS